MPILPRNLLKSFFERGDKPTQGQFTALIDSILHTTEDAERLGLRAYNPARVYAAGDTVLHNDTLYQALGTATGLFNAALWKKLSMGGELVTSVTWTQLKLRQMNNQLIKGERFLITDFTVDTSLVSDPKAFKPKWVREDYIYPVDPMIVTALSVNTISDTAFCPKFPQDIIQYNFDQNRITFRKDTKRNLSTHYDWRHWKFRRWESQPYKGDFLFNTVPFSEPQYLYATVISSGDPSIGRMEVAGDASAAGMAGEFVFRYMNESSEWITLTVIITKWSVTYLDAGTITTFDFNAGNYPALTVGLEGQVVYAIRYRDFYTFGNSLRTGGESFLRDSYLADGMMDMVPAPDGNAGQDTINIELGPVSDYWWGKYANGHIFDQYCYNIKIGEESIDVTMFSGVWDVEMGSDIYGGLFMGTNAKIYVSGGNSVFFGNNTGGINVLGSGEVWDFFEIGYESEVTYKVAIGNNCHSLSLLNCRKPGTRSAPGIPDFTQSEIFTDRPISHVQNTDSMLAMNTTDQVTANELRKFLNDTAAGNLLVGSFQFRSGLGTNSNESALELFDPGSSTAVVRFMNGKNNSWITSGSLGIGTSTPGARLHVRGNSDNDSTYSLFTENTAGANSFYVRDDGRVHAGGSLFTTNLVYDNGSQFAIGYSGDAGSRLFIRNTATAERGLSQEIYNSYAGSGNATGLSITMDGNHDGTNFGLTVVSSNTTGNSYAIRAFGNNYLNDGSTGFGLDYSAEYRIAVSAASTMRAASYFVNNRTTGVSNGIEVQSNGSNANANVGVDVVVANSSSTNVGLSALVSNAVAGGNAYGIKIAVSDQNGNGEIYAGAFTGGNVGIGTLTPASRLEVSGGDIKVSTAARGVILTSANGTAYRVIVQDDGVITTQAV